jgi:hypothetical protein
MDVGDLQDAGLDRLHLVAEARRHHHEAEIGDAGDLHLALAGADGLDSDLYLYTGPGNSAFGHVTLSFATLSGVVKFSGGTGRFRGFRARVIVTYNPDTDLWHWDGAYRFSRDDD